MSAPICLIQLVSEQTLQNVLPALALPPARLVLLHTTRTRKQATWITDALKLAGHTPEVRLVPLTDTPDVQETGAAVRTQLRDAATSGLTPLLNFTGGTKLMSLGAFAAALKEKCGSLYVDTEHRRFVDGATGPIPDTFRDGWATLSGLERTLTVPLILAANGLRLSHAGRDFAPLLPLAEHLRVHEKEEYLTHRVASEHLKASAPRKPRPADYLAAIDRPLALGSDVARLAVSAGLLVERGGEVFLPCSDRARLNAWSAGKPFVLPEFLEVVRPIQESLAFLSGAWWEVCVADAMRRSGRFRDVRWSAEVLLADSAPLEEDILAIDSLQLAYVSCKRGGDGGRLLRSFEELENSARRLGGSFTSRFFAIAQPIASKHLAEVQTRARSSRAQLIGPAARLSPALFAQE